MIESIMSEVDMPRTPVDTTEIPQGTSEGKDRATEPQISEEQKFMERYLKTPESRELFRVRDGIKSGLKDSPSQLLQGKIEGDLKKMLAELDKVAELNRLKSKVTQEFRSNLKARLNEIINMDNPGERREIQWNI